MSTTEPWKTEVMIQDDLAKKLIEQQFNEIHVHTIESFGQGWDNKAFLINQQWIFRFPTRQLAADLMRTEIQLLPILDRKLPIPIPSLNYIGKPSSDFSWPFAGYTLLHGKTACRAQLTTKQRSVSTLELARFLKALHSPQMFEQTKKISLPADLHQKSNPNFRIPFTRKHLISLEARHLITAPAAFDALLATCAQITPHHVTTLVHGDLYVRHLLLNDQYHLSGIIDWGDAHIGHPAVDLGIVYSFLPAPMHTAFWNEYGSVDEETHLLAMLRALYSSLMLIDYGDKMNDHDLVREGQWCIEQLKQLSGD